MSINIDNYKYLEYDYKIIITSYIGSEEVVIIPNEIKGLPVVRIGSSAFYSNKQIKEVILGENIKVIESNAFSRATNLKYINFNGGLEVIENNAFEHCHSLSFIYLPNSLRLIGSNAFNQSHYSLSSVVINSNKLVMQDDAFGTNFSASFYSYRDNKNNTNFNNLLIYNENRFKESMRYWRIIEEENIIYLIDDARNKATIISYRDQKNELVISVPDDVLNYSVYKINNNSFRNTKHVLIILLGRNIEKISGFSFEGSSIKEIFYQSTKIRAFFSSIKFTKVRSFRENLMLKFFLNKINEEHWVSEWEKIGKKLTINNKEKYQLILENKIENKMIKEIKLSKYKDLTEYNLNNIEENFKTLSTELIGKNLVEYILNKTTTNHLSELRLETILELLVDFAIIDLSRLSEYQIQTNNDSKYNYTGMIIFLEINEETSLKTVEGYVKALEEKFKNKVIVVDIAANDTLDDHAIVFVKRMRW